MAARSFPGRSVVVALGAASLFALGPVARANAAFAVNPAADTAIDPMPAQAATQLSAALGDGGGLSGGSLPVALLTFGGFVLGGIRLSRGILRASGTLARSGKRRGEDDSFEARLAAGLRALEQAAPVPPPAPAAPPAVPPAPPPTTGARTFGRRAN